MKVLIKHRAIKTFIFCCGVLSAMVNYSDFDFFFVFSGAGAEIPKASLTFV